MMTYYKIIQDGKITDVGFVFLKWNTARHRMMNTTPRDAQFIQASDESRAYRTAWLADPPKEAGEYETVYAVVIDENEYKELREQLDIDKEIVVPEDEPVPEPEPPAEPDPTPMGAAEMRQIILEQKDQISMLTDCILEMSEIIYGEEP